MGFTLSGGGGGFHIEGDGSLSKEGGALNDGEDGDIILEDETILTTQEAAAFTLEEETAALNRKASAASQNWYVYIISYVYLLLNLLN